MAYNIRLPRRIQREENRVQQKHTRERERERARTANEGRSTSSAALGSAPGKKRPLFVDEWIPPFSSTKSRSDVDNWNLILHTRILYRIYHYYGPMLSDQLGEFFWLESTLHGPFHSVKM